MVSAIYHRLRGGTTPNEGGVGRGEGGDATHEPKARTIE